MITLDSSVVVKWFKRGERYTSEAVALRERLERREVDGVANEIISLEVVRALKNASVRQPMLSITDTAMESAFSTLEGMFQTGILLECSVHEVKTRAKEIQMGLGLFMADALHLATATYLRTPYFVVDDHHFLSSAAVNYAAGFGVKVLDLPNLLNTTGASTRKPPPSAGS